MIPSASNWPSYSAAFFLSGVFFLVVGIGMGIYMSASENFLLRPVHAHVNLLGWVTSAIMGLFYAFVGDRLSARLIWAQYISFTSGVVVGMTGLAGLLLEVNGFLIALPVGVGLMLVSVLLFGWMVIVAARSKSAA